MENEFAFGAALITAVIAFALMWWLSRSARATPAVAGGGSKAAAPMHDDLLLRFVVDASGERKGETVAVDGDRMILKTATGFASVDASQLKSEGATLRLEGDVDWERARAEGEAWRLRSHKEITYSPEELPKDAS